MAQYKKKRALPRAGGHGCLVQRYAAELREQMPEVDLLMGVSDYPQICSLLSRDFLGERPVAGRLFARCV